MVSSAATGDFETVAGADWFPAGETSEVSTDGVCVVTAVKGVDTGSHPMAGGLRGGGRHGDP